MERADRHHAELMIDVKVRGCPSEIRIRIGKV